MTERDYLEATADKAEGISTLLKSHHPEHITPAAYADISRALCHWIDGSLLPYLDEARRRLEAVSR